MRVNRFPVDDLKIGLGIIRPTILEVQIVSLLSDVNTRNGNLAAAPGGVKADV